MRLFTKQLLFLLIGVAVITVGGLAIWANGGLKVNPILGHDLDLNALYYGQAANNTVHDITTQDISISAWVKVDVDCGNFTIISKNGTGGMYSLVYYRSVPQISIYYYQDAGHYYEVRQTYTLHDNRWHHIAAYINFAGKTGKIYVDGQNISSYVANNGVVTSIGNTGIFRIPSTFDGQIRDVKLYYAAGDHWTDAQVLYQAQHPFDYTANAGILTDYWRLDEGTGTTLYGKVNNLTLSNVLAWTTQPKIKMVKQENSTTTGNNPVGWWKMDEGTGQYAYDVSGNGNTGTLGTSTVADGADPTWTTGKLGKGLSFDGSNDYVSVTSSDNLKIINAITISSWIKLNALGTNQGIVAKDNGVWNGTGNYQILIDANNYVEVRWEQDSTHFTYSHSQMTFSLNTWYHIVAQYWKNADNSYSLKVYVNGVLITMYCYKYQSPPDVNWVQVSCDAIPITPLTNNYPVTLGWYGHNAATYFNGIIDDVRIYNRALSAGEVAQMFNSTKDGYLGNIKVSTGLVGYWKLDDNNALTSVIDYSGKGNTGTAYSGTATSTSVLSTSTAMIGRAMSFDGVDDWVAGSMSNLFASGNATFSFWAKNSTTTGQGDALGFAPDGILNIYPYYDGNIKLSLGWKSWDFDNTGVVPVAVGTWAHYVVVVDSSMLRMYLNGTQIWSANRTTSPSNNPTNFRIGSRNQSTYKYFNGLIDEVKIWNYARSAEDIKNDYAKGLSGLQ